MRDKLVETVFKILSEQHCTVDHPAGPCSKTCECQKMAELIVDRVLAEGPIKWAEKVRHSNLDWRILDYYADEVTEGVRNEVAERLKELQQYLTTDIKMPVNIAWHLAATLTNMNRAIAELAARVRELEDGKD